MKRTTTLWIVLLLAGLLADCTADTSTPQPPAVTAITALAEV